jgi:hypothetical protein
MRTYSDSNGTLVIEDITPDDHETIVELLRDVEPTIAVTFAEPGDRPLLSRRDVDRLMHANNRCTAAVLILIIVIALIQFGRFVGVTS